MVVAVLAVVVPTVAVVAVMFTDVVVAVLL